MGDTVRLKVVLDQALCTESQETQGLKRCWILLKPQHRTISDLSSYLLRAFSLQDACPNGLLLSMEGFVLPPFESTCILKDKDVIRVKRRGGGESRELIEADGDDRLRNGLEVVEIVDKPPGVTTAMNLLANEEFQKESGGYESEPEDDVDKEVAEEEEEEQALSEKAPEEKTVSKKRKASKELHSSKRKKKKSASAKKCAIVSENVGNGHAKQKGTPCTTEANGRSRKKSKDTSNKKRKVNVGHHTEGIGLFTAYKDCLNGTSHEIRSDQPEDNDNTRADVSHASETKKFPSRSARRKKAKRQWLREKLKAERIEQERQLLEKLDQQSSDKENPPVVSAQSLDKENYAVSAQSPMKGNHKISEKIPDEDSNKLTEDNQRQDPDSDMDDDVVPIVIRPGHIRFQPLGKVATDQTIQQNQNHVETFQWNGITSKKKGQKWGKQKVASSKWNGYDNFNEDWSGVVDIEEEKPTCDSIDFDKLPFYTTLPQEGDVIAYRLIELSSSWTPEISSYRVGKISQYDCGTNRVILVQIPEHPVIPKKIDDEVSPEPSDTFPYGEDGSLEIDFSSLLEVRVFGHDNQDSAKSVAGGVNEVHGRDHDATKGSELSDNNGAHALPKGNGETELWKEINQVLEAKKAQLSHEGNGSPAESSKRRSWSSRGLRGSALGPTVALLRSQDGL
ncbi:hypothetical protein Tsubulata_021227 [Turnera subulata]|uniref:Coilin n=1 Tax=Turnera subulata TaxID=218843 RepID=A0A9Q0FLG9_9ROSI|nr:hypothetical protein Tsubulata_021227 [Turnera subulata]